MKRRLLTVFWTIVISFLFTGVAYAANGEETTVKTVAAILAPLAAAALGIERALEMFWGIVESIGDIIMKKDQSDNPEAGSEKTDWTDKDKYKSFKTWFSALLGLVAGVIIAFQTNLMMFSLIGFDNVIANADIFVTGMVIGSGSKFTHDVIGIFSEGKKLVEQTQGLVRRKKEEIPTSGE
jgi:hypothetical protein